MTDELDSGDPNPMRLPVSRAQKRAWGRETEERFFEICAKAQEEGRFPYWLIRFERATRDEDRKGVDAWAITQDTVRIPFNIKRSLHGSFLSRRRLKRNGLWYSQKRYAIRNIVVPPYMDDVRVLENILQVSNLSHAEILRTQAPPRRRRRRRTI